MTKKIILPLIFTLLLSACDSSRETNETLLKITANGKAVPLERYANWFDMAVIQQKINETTCKAIITPNGQLANIQKGNCGQDNFEKMLKNKRENVALIQKMPEIRFELDQIQAPTQLTVKHKVANGKSYILLPYDFVASIFVMGE